jgi:hypothetical protein
MRMSRKLNSSFTLPKGFMLIHTILKIVPTLITSVFSCFISLGLGMRIELKFLIRALIQTHSQSPTDPTKEMHLRRPLKANKAQKNASN